MARTFVGRGAGAARADREATEAPAMHPARKRSLIKVDGLLFTNLPRAYFKL
jgi:hypothetical protein